VGDAKPVPEIASLPVRFRAALLDVIILSLLQGALGVPIEETAILWLAYFVLFEGFFGAIPAKEMFGLRVVRLDGSPVGFRRAIGRNLPRIIDFLPAFYVAGARATRLSPLHQRIGDKAAGTIVVVARPPYRFLRP
jgi:uncharacterized RDD family membrane protein YckC